jgi:hypothetical protein
MYAPALRSARFVALDRREGVGLSPRPAQRAFRQPARGGDMDAAVVTIFVIAIVIAAALAVGTARRR